MGFITGLFSGDKGSNFQASQVPIYSQVGTGDQRGSFDRANTGLNQQQDFLNALQGQNGVANQSNVFAQQQALAAQLQQQAMGQGPNPAQIALANATGQNIAQQGALMGSQRGAGQNAGLLARQIGQQGAGIQQQAVGQSAQLQAQQQLAAQQALMQQQQSMAGLATQQVGQQQTGLNAFNSGSQGLLGGAQNAVDSYNNARVSQQNAANGSNAGVAAKNSEGQQGILGGLLGGAGSAVASVGSKMLGLASGGRVPQTSQQGSFLKNFSTMGSASPGINPMMTGMNQLSSGIGSLFGGRQAPQAAPAPLPFMTQPGVLAVPQQTMPQAMPGMEQPQELMASQGAIVPGQAPRPGDDSQNDVVPAMLSPGEIVIPRSMAMDPMKAAAFAHSVAMQNHLKRS